MPASNSDFPWMSHYGHYKFFEERMTSHSRTLNLAALEGGLYELERDYGDTLRVFICECYSYGIAEYFETSDNHDALNAIIINSNWCGYTDEAKLHCIEQQVGLFTIKEFMAALNKPDFWTYLSAEQKERFEKNGWL